MYIQDTIQCKNCKNFTARLESRSGSFTIYKCYFCNTTFGGSVEKGYKEMGKKKKNKKNKKKNNNQNVNTTVSKTNAVNDSWEVEIDCVEQCSKIPEKVIIWVTPLAKRKIDALMNEYKSIEWLAYLIGNFEDKIVTDIFVPDQEITSTSVDNVQCEEFNSLDIIGVIHSHHDMHHNFSHTDETWINQNHDISLVISNSGISGQCRMKTACGAYKIVDVDVKLRVEIEFDDKEFIESVKEKIKRKVYTPPTYSVPKKGYQNGYNGYGYGYGYNHNQWTGLEKEDKDKKKDGITGEENCFITKTEIEELEKEIEELDFEKELSLAEELEMLEQTDNLDDKEAN